jgi:hypothetical protein
MRLRAIAWDRLGAVGRGRRLGSLPLRVCCAALALWCLGAGAADPPVVPYAGSRSSATSLTRTELRDIFFPPDQVAERRSDSGLRASR